MKKDVKAEFDKRRYEKMLEQETVRASEILALSIAQDEYDKFVARYGQDVEFDPHMFELRGEDAINKRLDTGENVGFKADDHDYRLVYVGENMDLSEVDIPKLRCYDYMFAGQDVVIPARFPNSARSFEGTYKNAAKLLMPGDVPISARNINQMWAGSGIEYGPDLSRCSALETAERACADCNDIRYIVPTMPENDTVEISSIFDKDINEYEFVPSMSSNTDISPYMHPDGDSVQPSELYPKDFYVEDPAEFEQNPEF